MKNFKIKNKDNKISHGGGNSLRNNYTLQLNYTLGFIISLNIASNIYSFHDIFYFYYKI